MTMSGPVPTFRSEITIAAARLRLFVSSYAPAFVIFAVRFNGFALRLCCGAVALIGVADSATILRRAVRKTLPYEIAISSVEDVGGEVSGYLASYLLPFVTVSSPSPRDLVGYGIFLVVAAIVYVRSDLVRVNPTLYLFGYRVLSVTFGERGQQYLITRRTPRPATPVSVVDVAGVLLATGGDVAR